MSLLLPLPAAEILVVTSTALDGVKITTDKFSNNYPALTNQFYTSCIKRLADGTTNPMAGQLLVETKEVLTRAMVRGKFT